MNDWNAQAITRHSVSAVDRLLQRPSHTCSGDELFGRMHRAAVQHIVATVEAEATRLPPQSARLYDVAPMLDERENGPECVDMNLELLNLGIELLALGRKPGSTWVRIVVELGM